MHEHIIAIKDELADNLSETIQTCKTTMVFKPHLAALGNRVTEIDTFTHEHQKTVLEMDKSFYKHHLSKLSYNKDTMLRYLATKYSQQWYFRIPNWLNVPSLALAADNEYRHAVLGDPKTPYFNASDVPDMAQIISHVKPSIVEQKPVSTPFGNQTLRIYMTKPLDYKQFVTVFIETTKLKVASSKFLLKDQPIVLSSVLKDILEKQLVVDDVDNVELLRELSVVCCSAMPASAMLNFILKRLENITSLDALEMTSLKAQAMDKDVKFAALRRHDDKPILTTRQIKNVLKKLFTRYPGLTKGLDVNVMYSLDYSLWETLRYVTTDPLEAAVEMHKREKYLNAAKKRFTPA